MGMFSFLCCKCNEPINYGTRAAILTPCGDNIYTDYYDGYGRFNGVDIFERHAEDNAHLWPEVSSEGLHRDDGINLYYNDDDQAPEGYNPLKAICGRCCTGPATAASFVYDNYGPSESDPNQGFNNYSYETSRQMLESLKASGDWECPECGQGDCELDTCLTDEQSDYWPTKQERAKRALERGTTARDWYS